MLYQAKVMLRQIQSIERCFVNSDQVLGSWEEQPMESIEYSTLVATLTQIACKVFNPKPRTSLESQ